MVCKNFDELVERVKGFSSIKRISVAAADDRQTLEAVMWAQKEGIVRPILIGDRTKILGILEEIGIHTPECDIIDEPDTTNAAVCAVRLFNEGEVDFLMKGMLDTKVMLIAGVNRESGIGIGGIMSSFAIFQVWFYHKLLTIVDGGMVTYPTLEQKKEIIEITVATLLDLGYDCPKVGVLACVEKVNPQMPETVEAYELAEMNRRGDIKHCIVEGPISYDCAMSKEIAEVKGFESRIAGDVDIVVAPDIHTANIMGKVLIVNCKAKMAGFIVGAKCPIVLTSRGSSAEEKYLSIVLSAAAANRGRT